MRTLILAACVMLTACAGIGQKTTVPIRVTGTGTTLNDAKIDAFNKAIEIQVGSLVLSEREVFNDVLVKNEILSYSAGYVENFTIVNQDSNRGSTTVTLDVRVASSKLAQRILAKSKSAVVLEGDQHEAQYQTYLQDRHQGDVVLHKVLDDYPRRAFDITQEPHHFALDSQRNAVIAIPFELKWNRNYIESFKEAMALLEDGSNGFMTYTPATVTIAGNGSSTKYRFNDMIRTAQIRSAFIEQREVRIKLAIRDINNQIAYSNCWAPDAMTGRKPSFYNTSNHSNTALYSNIKEQNMIRLSISPTSPLIDIIKNSNRIELSIVPVSDCTYSFTM